MGKTDKLLRILAAIAISVLYLTGYLSGITGTIMLVFAGILVLTAFMNFCPLYRPFEISTIKK